MKIDDTVAQGIFQKYFDYLMFYLSHSKINRINGQFHGFIDLKFMQEFEQKILPVVRVTNWSEGIADADEIASDAVREFIANILLKERITKQIPDSCGYYDEEIKLVYYEKWNEIHSIEECVESYLKNHPELTRNTRFITDDWEVSNDSH